MPKYEYSGDADLVFPTLGIQVSKGDVFMADADLTVAGVATTTKKITVANSVVDTTSAALEAPQTASTDAPAATPTPDVSAAPEAADSAATADATTPTADAPAQEN